MKGSKAFCGYSICSRVSSETVPFAALLCATIFAALCAVWAARFQERTVGSALATRTDETMQRIESRLDAYENLLREGAAHFGALRALPTETEWKAWSERAGIPGAALAPEALGFVSVATAGGRSALERALRSGGHRDRRIVPAGYRNRYAVIAHRSPASAAGGAIPGLDLYAHPALRAALDRAASSGRMALARWPESTGSVMGDTRDRLLALFPVFVDEDAPWSGAADSKGLAGFLLLTLKARALFDDAAGGRTLASVLRVARSGPGTAASHLYVADTRPDPEQALLKTRRTLDLGSDAWLVDVGATETVLRAAARLPWYWTPGAGAGLTLCLLAALFGHRRLPLHRLLEQSPSAVEGQKVLADQITSRQGGDAIDGPAETRTSPGKRSDAPRHEASDAGLRAAWESVNDGIVIMDPRLRIVDVNPAFSRMSGLSREEVLGKTPRFFRCVDGGAVAHRSLQSRLKRDGHWEGRSWNCRKNGSTFIASERTSSLLNDAGEVTHYVTVLTDITATIERERRLLDTAHFDPLTGIPNRGSLCASVVESIAQAHLGGTPIAIFYIDLDRFKVINDRLGHGAGDELLIQVAQRLSTLAGPLGLVARAGGDEFILVLKDLLEESQVGALAERVQGALRGTYRLAGNKEVYVSASIGVATYPRGGTEAEQLLRQADRAMYVAKDRGRDRYELFDVDRKRELDAQRRRVRRIVYALQDGELELFYQPKVNMRTGAVVGAEALLRWIHPEEGIIAPDQFLPLVAGTDQGAEIDRWVVGEALRMVEKLRSAGMELQIGVNIDSAYLQKIGFLKDLSARLDQHPNLPRHLIELEILESIALTDLDNIGLLIEHLHQLGVRVALDDFGTGYSSLAYLRKLPTDTLKIDKSFIVGMFDDEYSLSLVKSIIDLASTFDRKVIAEGVETQRHGAALVRMGCELGQGYGIARPMPAGQFCEWLKARRSHPTAGDSGTRNVVRLGQADTASA